MAAAPPPPLPDELLEEILLRLPPDHPAYLLRASLVCKDWADIVSRPAFRRRLHELHQIPPILGFLDRRGYVPTIASSFSPAAPPDHRSWDVLDCRHGRALFVSKGRDRYAGELLVWEPITGAQQRVPWPAAYPSESDDYPTMAAVFCAADGCDHRDCFGGPFHVLIDVDMDVEDSEGKLHVPAISVCVYSSEIGAWGELTSILYYSLITQSYLSTVLVGRSLLYFMFYDSFWDEDEYGDASILEYDLSRHTLSVLSFGPPDDNYCECHLMLAEDGGLGVIQDLEPHLKLWTREASDCGNDAQWVLSRVIDLGNLLPTSARLYEDLRVHVMGFAEGANAILFDTVDGVFTIELQSEHVSKLCSDHGFGTLIPVVSFYTPVPRGKPSEEPNEEAGGEEGGEEEKIVDWAQLLLSKGSNATKEGGFVNAFECVSNDHNIRVPCYGNGTLEGATVLNKHGCVLLPKDSSGDISKSAPNEESVKGTTSKDDAGNSMTSDSNVEGASASEKEKFSNRASHHKLVRYRDEGKTRKGPDFNPSQQPLDPELVMISGGGRHYGSLAIGDGLIRSSSTLPQIKKRQTSSDPEILPRARPVELEFKAAIEAERAKTQAALEEQRAKTQALLEERDRQAAEREREREDRTAKMLEERNRNMMANRALYEMFATLCEKTGTTPPPMPVVAPAGTIWNRGHQEDEERKLQHKAKKDAKKEILESK